MREGMSLERKKGSGRPRKLNLKDQQQLIQLARNDDTQSARDIQIKLNKKGSLKVVPRTITRYLEQSGYFSFVPKNQPLLSPVQQENTVKWCEEQLRTRWNQWIVDIERGKVAVKEAFLDFIQIHGKSAEAITTEITKKLNLDGLNFQDCKSQSCDNQATMAGANSGVQKRTLDLNSLAIFVPCNNHSLNLVGVHAAHVNSQAVTFFGTLEKLFVFFSSSTHRWEVLKEYVKIAVKSHSDTRWSSKAVAVTSISTQLKEVLAALKKLRDSSGETLDSRGDAGLILSAIQSKEITFKQALIQLGAFTDEIENWRNALCTSFITKAEEMCEKWDITLERRIQKRRIMSGEKNRN
ncbi:uncharacterized protein LOC136091951 [Hydra vulgaris]|uniref:Uncharacterized protein LOC136091951 n=1 Tax=Hydra vulgaris TaxID=6087 RepID=A0ABM4DMG8_HYDVU